MGRVIMTRPIHFTTPRCVASGRCKLSKKASQSSPHMRRIESQSFLTAACTWAKIRIRLQVWNLFTAGKQIMRATDCKKLAEKPEGFFDKLKRPGA